MTSIRQIRRVILVAPVIALVAALSACASSAGGSDGDLSITDPWAKAADSGMTAAFGTLTNATDQDITLTAATSDVAMMELHEVVEKDGQMVMQPKEGGFVIPAGGSATLEPGHDHIMFMDLSEPLEAGADVDVTLTSQDGRSWTFTFPVRTFDGAAENYDGGDSMGDMDMGSQSPSEDMSGMQESSDS